MSQPVWTLMIVGEEVLSKKLIMLIRESGAKGCSVNAAGGEVSRNVRSRGEPCVCHAFSNVKIQVQMAKRELADKITRDIEVKYTPIVLLLHTFIKSRLCEVASFGRIA